MLHAAGGWVELGDANAQENAQWMAKQGIAAWVGSWSRTRAGTPFDEDSMA